MSQVPVGHTNERMFVKLLSTSTGQAMTGVAYTAVFGSYFIRGTSITPMDATSELASPGTGHSTAHTDLAWHEVHATEHPGLYTFDIPDAAFSTAGLVMISLVVSGSYGFDSEYQVGPLDVNAVQLNGSAAAASNLSYAAQTMIYGLVDAGTFTPTTTQFQTDTAGFSSVNDAYKDRKIHWIVGAGMVGEGASITSYDGTNKRFTVSTMTGAPPDNAEFIVV